MQGIYWINYTCSDPGFNIFLEKKGAIRYNFNIDSKRSNLIILMKQVMWFFFLILMDIEKEYLSASALTRAGQEHDFHLIYIRNRVSLSV